MRFRLGHGNSEGPRKGTPAVPFLEDLISKMEISKFILVSPSMSGMYTMPFLKTLAHFISYNTRTIYERIFFCFSHNEKMVGFVAAAPTYTDQLSAEDAQSIKVSLILVELHPVLSVTYLNFV